MTPDEQKQLNELVLKMPIGQRKKLWDTLNNSGKFTKTGINGDALRRSLQETERKGLRWLQLKKEAV